MADQYHSTRSTGPQVRDPSSGRFVVQGVRRKDWRRFKDREDELWRDCDRAWPTVLQEGVLDLEAIEPPKRPKGRSAIIVSARVDLGLGQWVRRSAQERGESVSDFVARCIRNERAKELPDDIEVWLGLMANQLGMPGDREYALTRILRHLADRWPRGARLAETRGYKLSLPKGRGKHMVIAEHVDTVSGAEIGHDER